jgi:hypothetical protein
VPSAGLCSGAAGSVGNSSARRCDADGRSDDEITGARVPRAFCNPVGAVPHAGFSSWLPRVPARNSGAPGKSSSRVFAIGDGSVAESVSSGWGDAGAPGSSLVASGNNFDSASPAEGRSAAEIRGVSASGVTASSNFVATCPSASSDRNENRNQRFTMCPLAPKERLARPVAPRSAPLCAYR